MNDDLCPFGFCQYDNDIGTSLLIKGVHITLIDLRDIKLLCASVKSYVVSYHVGPKHISVGACLPKGYLDSDYRLLDFLVFNYPTRQST